MCNLLTRSVFPFLLVAVSFAAQTQAQTLTAGFSANTALPPVEGQAAMARISESHIFFTAGGARLDAAAQETIQRLGAVLSTGMFSGTCLRLVGHSDTIGSAEANLNLSMRRAQIVADALSERLTANVTIEYVQGRGETEPLSVFAPEDARQRRVAIEARHCG